MPHAAIRTLPLLLLLSAAGLQSAPRASAQGTPLVPPLRFTTLAADLNAERAGTAAGVVDITITRWSTEAQTQDLLALMKKPNRQAVIEYLRDQPSVGYISSPGTLRYDLRFAHHAPGEDGGYQITLATDRPINILEVLNQTRTLQYPLTLIQMRLDNNLEGEGSLTVAAKLIAAAKAIVVENYESQPVRLLSIRPSK